MYKCDCEEYKENMPKIVDIFIYSHVHGFDYQGEEFIFCPWCGKEFVFKSKREENKIG